MTNTPNPTQPTPKDSYIKSRPLFGQVQKVDRDGERVVIYIRPAVTADEFIRVGDYLILEIVGRALIANGKDENGKEYWDFSSRVEAPGEKWQDHA